MSYRQPKYIAPADANVAIEKFNESMTDFADKAKKNEQQKYCRENPGACEDDSEDGDGSKSNNTSKTPKRKAVAPYS